MCGRNPLCLSEKLDSADLEPALLMPASHDELSVDVGDQSQAMLPNTVDDKFAPMLAQPEELIVAAPTDFPLWHTIEFF